MGWFVARHASRTRLLALAYLEKSRRRKGKFNDSFIAVNRPVGDQYNDSSSEEIESSLPLAKLYILARLASC